MLIALLFALINFNIFCVAAGIPAGDSLASLPIVAENAFKSIHHAETTLIKPNLNSMEAHLRSLCKRSPGNCDFTNLPELARENVYYQSILNSHSHPKDILNLMRTNDDLAKRVLSETDPRFRSKMSAVVQLASETGLDARENARNTHVLNLIYDQPNLVKWASSEGDDYVFTLEHFKSLESHILGYISKRSESERYIQYVLSHDHFLADADRQFFVVKFLDHAALFSNVPLMKGLLVRRSWSSLLTGNDIVESAYLTSPGVTDLLLRIVRRDPALEAKFSASNFAYLWQLAFRNADLRTIDLLVTVPESRFSGESIARQFQGLEDVAVFKHFIDNKDFLMRIPPRVLQNLIWQLEPDRSGPILTSLFKHNQYLLRAHDRFLQETFVNLLYWETTPFHVESFFNHPGFTESLSDHDWRLIVHSQAFPTMARTLLANPLAKSKIVHSLSTHSDPAGLYGFMTSDMNFARELLQIETPVMEQQLRVVLSDFLPSSQILQTLKPPALLQADQFLFSLILEKVGRARFKHRLSNDVFRSIEHMFANDRPDLSEFLARNAFTRKLVVLHGIPRLIESVISTPNLDLSSKVVRNRFWVELFNEYTGKRLISRILEGGIPVDAIFLRPNLLRVLHPDLVIKTVLENQDKPELHPFIVRLVNNHIITEHLYSYITSQPMLPFDTMYSLMRFNPRLISAYVRLLPFTANIQELSPIIDRAVSNGASANMELDRLIAGAYYLSDSVSVDQFVQSLSREMVEVEWLIYVEKMLNEKATALRQVELNPEQQQRITQKLDRIREMITQKRTHVGPIPKVSEKYQIA